MRRLAHFLIILAVVFCGSHLSAAEADGGLADRTIELHLEASSDHDDGGKSEPAGVAHAGHHHCPIAPDHDPGLALCEPAPTGPLLFAPPIASLRSLATAPPTQPPSA